MDFFCFFVAVLGRLSLFDLFVVEQSLKCDDSLARIEYWNTSIEESMTLY